MIDGQNSKNADGSLWQNIQNSLKNMISIRKSLAIMRLP